MEVGNHALTFLAKYPKYRFIRTSVNNWKNKCKAGDNVVFKKVGRQNLLDQNIIKKVKDIAIGTRQAGGVINRRQIINIARGVKIIPTFWLSLVGL